MRSLIKKKKIPTETNNDYNYYYNWLKLLAITSFKWENVPDTIDKRYIESALFCEGKLCYFNDETIGDLLFKCNSHGELNVYYQPLKWNVFGNNYNKVIDAKDCEIIRNTDTEEQTSFICHFYAQKLAQTNSVKRTNIEAQRMPYFLLGNEKQLLTMKNMYEQIKNGEPAIFGDKNIIDMDLVKIINTQSPYIVDKLDSHTLSIWSEALTRLGINNSNIEKKERLITDEVNSNDEMIKINLLTRLNPRLEACERINKHFGTNISVKFVYGNDEKDEFEDKEDIDSE